MYPLHSSSLNYKSSYHSLYLRVRQLIKNYIYFLGLSLGFILAGCDGLPPIQRNSGMHSSKRGEFISRLHEEEFKIPAAEKKVVPSYPWEKKLVGGFPIITKEYFRCKGECNHSAKLIEQGAGHTSICDCGGIEEHSLPTLNQKEFIYPILIDLLNYIQAQANKPVIITSGHRCPMHNRYNDPSPASQYSKHMIGAEVNFYVKGLERQPERIIDWLQAYFKQNQTYAGLHEYLEFKRWDKKSDVSTPPWYNKEVFIKLYKPNEGRNFDNQHAYPYIAIQVRYDRNRNERVEYSWERAFNHYLRW